MTRVLKAMVLAAGRGERMRPLTDVRPKPLIEVYGRTMLDRALDHLRAAGVRRIVVNACHLAPMISAHLEGQRDVVVSEEPVPLETGGGVRRALDLLGPGPFFVVNGDVVWLDGPRPALTRLREAWNGRQMDALLLMVPTVNAQGYGGVGDYFLSPDGRARRRREREVAPFLFAGVQILHPRLVRAGPEGPFSLNLLYDRAEQADRLHGLVHDGEWYHVGTEEELRRANRALALRHVAVHSR